MSDKINQVTSGKLNMQDEPYHKLSDQNHQLLNELSNELNNLNQTFERYLKIK